MDKDDVIYIDTIIDKEETRDVCVCIYIYIYIYTHTHTQNGILLSHTKNKILACATTWIDLVGTMLREMSDSEREILYDTTWLQNLKVHKLVKTDSQL